MYVGDGAWKSGAEGRVMALAEYFGVPVAGDTRSLPIRHPQHCGSFEEAVAAIDPDRVLCIGVRQRGLGHPADYGAFSSSQRIIAVGSGIDYLKNIPGVELAVLADESRTIERLMDLTLDPSEGAAFDERRSWARAHASALRSRRRMAAQRVAKQPSKVRPYIVADTLDKALEEVGGGLVMIEQFAVPLDGIEGADGPGGNVYLRPAGGSEGYGIGGAIGVKLAAPDRPVVGLVGDGSMYYADSGLWTAAHHRVPVLYIIANNGAYGIVAGAFQRAEGDMASTGEYEGVVLDGIDPVKIAEGFGVEGLHVREEAQLAGAIKRGLEVVEREGRPLLLNVALPLGLPDGGHAAGEYHLSSATARRGLSADAG
jgi:benzoylformate decarboxylase